MGEEGGRISDATVKADAAIASVEGKEGIDEVKVDAMRSTVVSVKHEQ